MHVIDERNESSEWPPSLFIPETGTSPTSIASLLKSFLFVKYVAFFWKVGGGAIMKGKLVNENKPGEPS